MNLSTVEYRELISYSKNLMYGGKYCDPSDLVNDAIVKLNGNASIEKLKKEIRANCVKERKITSGLVRIDAYENFSEISFSGIKNIPESMFIVCTKCKQEKAESEFYSYEPKYYPGIIKHQSQCKECLKEHYQKYAAYGGSKKEYLKDIERVRLLNDASKKRRNKMTPHEAKKRKAELMRQYRKEGRVTQSKEYSRDYYRSLSQEKKDEIKESRKNPEYRKKNNERYTRRKSKSRESARQNF